MLLAHFTLAGQDQSLQVAAIKVSSVSHEIAKIGGSLKGELWLENPVRRLCDFQHKKCNSDGLALDDFVILHLTNRFCVH